MAKRQRPRSPSRPSSSGPWTHCNGQSRSATAFSHRSRGLGCQRSRSIPPIALMRSQRRREMLAGLATQSQCTQLGENR